MAMHSLEIPKSVIPRPDVKGSHRPCLTPGCPFGTYTEEQRCWRCKEKRKAHVRERRAA